MSEGHIMSDQIPLLPQIEHRSEILEETKSLTKSTRPNRVGGAVVRI